MRIAYLIIGLFLIFGSSAQENTSRTGVLVEFEVLIYSSKPGENRTADQDPGLMLSFLHPFNDHFAVGLGTGMTSPYYTVTMMPVYIETIFWPMNDSGLFLKNRIGKMLPTNPDLFNGGTYNEVSLGMDISTPGKTAFIFAVGYSHQRMTSQNDDIWWGNRETDYRYNRAVLSLGMRF